MFFVKKILSWNQNIMYLSSSDKTRVNFVINDDGGGFSRIFPDFTRFSDLGVSVDVFLSVLIWKNK